MAVEKQGVLLRLPLGTLERAEQLVGRIGEDPNTQWGRITRAAVLRMAVLAGLGELERKYPKSVAPVRAAPEVTRPSDDEAQWVRLGNASRAHILREQDDEDGRARPLCRLDKRPARRDEWGPAPAGIPRCDRCRKSFERGPRK